MDETILCVERYRAGRLAATEAALDGGRLLESARSRLNHGDRLPWLNRVGLNRATANRWMRLTRLGMTAVEILEAGGMRAVLEAQTTNQRPRWRTRREDSEAEVEEASEVVKAAKPAYYNAMTRRGSWPGNSKGWAQNPKTRKPKEMSHRETFEVWARKRER